MNFLAHVYLSQQHTPVLIGNFIADGIRGNKIHHYKDDIKFGIHMHRAIDTYTDKHPVFRQSKRRLDDKYRLYKGVIIDIMYDHFLAKNWHLYSNIPLHLYCDAVYTSLQNHYEILPPKTQKLLPYMTTQNWLYSYRTLHGIASILHDMNVRTKGISKMNEAIEDLKNNYADFEQDFKTFFEDMNSYCQQYLKDYEQ